MKPERSSILIIVTLMVVCGMSHSSLAQDVNWDDRFGLPNIYGDVNALAITDNVQVYVGGRFGGSPGDINYIALWDGRHWSGLGQGSTNGTTDAVNAIVTQGNAVYVGGDFASLNGQRSGYVAKWDGTQWNSLGTGTNMGVNLNVYALASDGTNLYAGGRFSTAGGISARNIAKWDGSSWSALGAGLGDANTRVTAIAISADGSVYAGGNFTNSGGAEVKRIAKWNGTSWLPLGAGMDNMVQAIAAKGNEVFVGGLFGNAGGTPAKRIAKWDGDQWSELGGGVTGGDIYSLTFDGSDLYVGGSLTEAGGVPAFGIAKWDGIEWSSLGAGVGGGGTIAVYSVVAKNGTVYAGGNFTSAEEVSASRVAKWDGQKWSALNYALDGGNPTLVNAVIARGTNVYVGGDFTSAGGASANRIAKWDGFSWSALGTVSSNGFDLPVLAIATALSGEVYAGGRFSEASGVSASRIAKWDGTKWSPLGSGLTSDGWIDAIAVAPNGNVYAGGAFSSIGGVSANNIARWDGTNWWDVGGGVTRGAFSAIVKAITVTGNEVYVGGSFDTAGSTAAVGIAKWDGQNWSAVGGGVTLPGSIPSVDSLAFDGTNLYAGGIFTQAGTANANHIARWDGQNWSALGGGADSDISAIAVFGKLVFIGGNFTMVAGQNIPVLAQWDGNAWSGLGSGVTGVSTHVKALSPTGTELLVGGSFRFAGQKPSNQFAGWALDNNPPVIAITSPASGANFPFAADVTVTADATDSDGSVSRVDFFAGDTFLGTATNSPYSVTWSNVFTGDYVIYAQATDNLGAIGNSAGVAIRVNPPTNDVPPVVNITNPTNGATFTGGTSLQIIADASDSDGNVTRVDFYAGGKLVGSSTNAPYSMTWNNLPVGRFPLAAKATDNFGATTTSGAVTISVVAPNSPPHISFTAPQEGAVFTTPATVQLTATALDTDGQVVKVEFFAGDTLLATLPTSSTYSFTWTDSQPGVITLTAKATDDKGAVTSAMVTIIVNGADRFSAAQIIPPNNPKQNFWIADAPVYSILETNGVVYVAGDFTHVGPFVTGSVVLNVFSNPPDTSYPVANGSVSVIAGDGVGGYYVGGKFTLVGELSRTNLAHIWADKTIDPDWSPVADAQVTTIALLDNAVYVGGDFTQIDGQPRIRLAALDAGTGAVLNWNPAPDNTVNALLATNGTVYVAGSFTNIGGLSRNRVAALDAITGTPAAWNPDADNTVWSVAFTGGQLIVAGQFAHVGGQQRYQLAGLDSATGNATTFNPAPLGQVNTVAVYGNTVYVGGFFTQIGFPNLQPRNNLAALDATTGLATAWNPNPNDGVFQIMPTGNAIYVVGPFSNIGGQDRNHFAALDPVTGLATDFDLKSNGSVSALTVSSNRVLIAGSGGLIQIQRNHVAAIDAATGAATSWNPDCNATVWSLAYASNTVYLGGDFNRVDGQPRGQLAAVDAGTGIPSAWNPAISGRVTALVVSSNTVYGGFNTTSGGQYLGALDATSGNALTWNPNPNGTVQSLILFNNTIYVCGSFTFIGGQARNYLAALDPVTGNATSWNPNPNGPVVALAIGGNTLYAGGAFSQIGGRGRISLAALNPITGGALPWLADSDGTVHALAFAYSAVYTGGQYGSIGGQTRITLAGLDSRITSSNATAWAPVVDDPSSIIFALAASPDTLYVGGRAKFGTELRPYLAAYDFPPRLEATRFSPQGQIQFDVAGAAGRNYIVQTSTDLSKWSSVLTNFGPFTVQDARTTNGALYYRVISPK